MASAAEMKVVTKMQKEPEINELSLQMAKDLIEDFDVKDVEAEYISADQMEKMKKKKKSLTILMKENFFFWEFKDIYMQESCEITNRIHLVEFNLEDALKKYSKACRNFDEIALVEVLMDWTPYFSKDMLGHTTVYLCDFRSTLRDNIIKAAYHFITSNKSDQMLVQPGYKVSLRDRNLKKIFRFVVITEGLDISSSSIYAKMSLHMIFRMSKMKCHLPDLNNRVTVVLGDGVKALTESKIGPLRLLNEELDLDQIFGEVYGLVDKEVNPKKYSRSSSSAFSYRRRACQELLQDSDSDASGSRRKSVSDMSSSFIQRYNSDSDWTSSSALQRSKSSISDESSKSRAERVIEEPDVKISEDLKELLGIAKEDQTEEAVKIASYPSENIRAKIERAASKLGATEDQIAELTSEETEREIQLLLRHKKFLQSKSKDSVGSSSQAPSSAKIIVTRVRDCPAVATDEPVYLTAAPEN